MRLTRNESERRIGGEVRNFLASSMPDSAMEPADFDQRIAWLREWQRELYEAGFVNVSWPRQYGGRGATLGEQMVVEEELALAGAPELVGVVGLGVVGPSIVAHGTDEQRARWLPKILSGEEIWCQGFSEPGAGSDLASLRTVADDRGDHWLLSGQKTWTSWAQHARWCAVLARTDGAAPPHRGISYLVADMRSAGVDVRPLVQLTGDAEFSEVYFDQVVIPKDRIIGEPNGGWSIAMHTLSHERGPAVAARAVKLRVLFDRLVADAGRLERDGRAIIEDERIRRTLARAHVQLEVLRCQSARTVGRMIATGTPGLETSIDKLQLTRAEQMLGDAALAVLGPAAPYAEPEGRSGEPDGRIDVGYWQGVYLYGRAASIYGGTSQVQKNIIAERILGLPRG
jgi:alkylation response protein AidB-like acyl-CoA dehydrogenase